MLYGRRKLTSAEIIELENGQEAIERTYVDTATGEEFKTLREVPPALRSMTNDGLEDLDPVPVTVTADLPLDHVRDMLTTGRLPMGIFEQVDLGEEDFEDLSDGTDFGITEHEAPFMEGFDIVSGRSPKKSPKQSTETVDKLPPKGTKAVADAGLTTSQEATADASGEPEA